MNFENYSSQEHQEKNEKLKQSLTEELGTLLHDEWRASRKLDNGSYQERVKVLAMVQKDGIMQAKWFNQGDEPTDAEIVFKQDIANTDFTDLHEDWKRDNAEAAKVAINLVFDTLLRHDSVDIEAASALVHEEWKKRNSWNNDPVLMGPYSELPEAEKQKDRDQIIKAINIVSARLSAANE